MNESPLQQSEWSIWWRWVVATFLGAVASCLVLLVAGGVIAGTRGTILGSLDTSLLVGSIFAGIVVAIVARAQQWAFHSYYAFEDDEVTGWWFASGIGTFVVTFVIAFIYNGDRPWWWLQDIVFGASYYGIAASIAVGLGTAQWVVLRRLGPGTGWWVLWNIVAAALICIVPSITRSWLLGGVIGILIYAMLTATAVLWLHFVLGTRDAEARASRMSSTSRQTTVLVSTSALFCIVVAVLCGVSGFLHGGIPDYPRAEHVTIDAITPRDTAFGRELTHFTTADAPKDVLLFYRNTLPNRGWDYNGNVIDPIDGWRSLSFITRGCPFGSVTITATVGLDERTVGEIEQRSQPCY